MTRGFAGNSSGSIVVVTAFAALISVVAFSSACGRPVGPAACTDPRDCAAGEACTAGTCTAGGVTSCITDLDCDLASGDVCSQGACVPKDDVVGGGSCTATADCPITEFCNTATGVCAGLLAGWCRQDSQCTGETNLCSNVTQGGSDFPGRCVACIEDADCDGGGTCLANTCQQDGGCKANASPVIGGECRCDPGFLENGAGDCVASQAEGEGEGEPAEGEGEGEPAEGEGEGEGEPVTGETCASAGECFELHDINWTCEANQCICDEPWLDSICDGDFNLENCECGGGSGVSTENDACFDDSDCGSLSCISGANTVLGACKVICSVNSDCSGGLTCMADLFLDGSGICADVKGRGETCDASIYSEDVGTNSLCDAGSADVLDCFDGVCEQVCDWAGNTGAELDCGADTCGSLVFRTEVSSSVAVCE